MTVPPAARSGGPPGTQARPAAFPRIPAPDGGAAAPGGISR